MLEGCEAVADWLDSGVDEVADAASLCEEV